MVSSRRNGRSEGAATAGRAAWVGPHCALMPRLRAGGFKARDSSQERALLQAGRQEEGGRLLVGERGIHIELDRVQDCDPGDAALRELDRVGAPSKSFLKRRCRLPPQPG